MTSTNNTSSADGLDIKKVCRWSPAGKLYINIKIDSRDRQR